MIRYGDTSGNNRAGDGHYRVDYLIAAVICLMLLHAVPIRAMTPPHAMPRIAVAPNHHGFILFPSGRAFYPWGFNYGNHGRLLEDFWVKHWSTVARDFQNMKALGANVVRVHLQYGQFMRAPDKPNRTAFKMLARLLALARHVRLYLDLTGLGCYRVADVPKWYNAMNDQQRWAAQARFWKQVAATCAHHHVIFCYDLMNEPLSPASRRPPGHWQPKSSFGGYDFMQYIALNPGHIDRRHVAVRWILAMTAAIRSQDKNTLITVGIWPRVPPWGWLSGFVPRVIAPHLDFIAVHIYPQTTHLHQAMVTLGKCAVGKPVVIEETFPLSCSAAEERQFLLKSRTIACGWLGHYNGYTLADYAKLAHEHRLTIGQAIYREWEEMFVQLKPRFVRH
ncbi:MAG: cellulase family glycosylhydrolase [Phycisphaerae bacterium]